MEGESNKFIPKESGISKGRVLGSVETGTSNPFGRLYSFSAVVDKIDVVGGLVVKHRSYSLFRNFATRFYSSSRLVLRFPSQIRRCSNDLT